MKDEIDEKEALLVDKEDAKRKARDNTTRTIRVLVIISIWMCISISLIMYNKWLLSYKHYRFPLAMTMCHQACTAMVAQITCRLGIKGMKAPELTPEQFKSRILPIALLFAASIALSNLAVSYLTVPFMQMLKASIPTFSLLIGFITGVEVFNMKLLLCVMGVCGGVVIASIGEAEFVPVGFCIAVVGLITEAARLVLTQRLLQGQDIKFNAITGNYYTAPIAFGTLAVPFLYFEAQRWIETVDVADMGPHIVLNGLLAALLNISVFIVLTETGAVSYSIAGQVKDWMNILVAIPVFGNVVSPLQLFGYVIAVVHVFYYKKLRTQMDQEKAQKLVEEKERQKLTEATQNLPSMLSTKNQDEE